VTSEAVATREGWSADALLGAHLGGCVIERPLAVGGMGAVYLARQDRPNRPVAIKVLRPQRDASPADQRRFLALFQREADATAALDHSHIVPIYAFGEEDGVAYLVMPYLPDGSLADLLVRHGPFSMEQTVRTVEHAAAALDYAHAHGIVHRDVKPSNLLLHADGRVLLTDFGIAQAVEAGASATRRWRRRRVRSLLAGEGETDFARGDIVLGTPAYMAPEQALDEAIGAATDVYALGAVAYTLLTGEPPFAGSDSAAILRRHVTEPPPPLPRPDVPPALEAVIWWALAKAPAERPDSAGAFARSLREASASAHQRSSRSKDDQAPRSEERADTGGHISGAEGAVMDANAPTEAVSSLRRPSSGSPRWPGGAEGDDDPWMLGRRLAWVALAAGMSIAVVLMAVAAGGGLFQSAPSLGAGGTFAHATPSPTPTATHRPSPALRIAPVPLVLTADPGGGHEKHHQQTCSATQTITNETARRVGWAWQPPGVVGLQFQVNGGDIGWPQDTSPGIAPGSSDTVSVTADCSAPIPSSSILMTDTLGNHYTFALKVQGGGNENGDGG
jgi:serine/threonine protein kinase